MRIALSTGGGDAPGLNAVIRDVVLAATRAGHEVLGVRNALIGLWSKPHDVMPLTPTMVDGLQERGGTLLGTSNEGSPFRDASKAAAMIQAIKDNWRDLKIDVLIAVGGDGSQLMARHLVDHGLPVIGIPKTIDNDLKGTDITLGHATAVTVATEAADRLHTTADAHSRIMILEVMGRDAGHIAIRAGIAAGAHGILVPEVPFSYDVLAAAINARKSAGRPSFLIVAAEGAHPVGGAPVYRDVALKTLGGIGEKVAVELAARTGLQARATVLGHLQRGGAPVADDRVLAAQLGVRAVELALQGKTGRIVGIVNGKLVDYGYETIDESRRVMDANDPLLLTAEKLGITLGR